MSERTDTLDADDRLLREFGDLDSSALSTPAPAPGDQQQTPPATPQTAPPAQEKPPFSYEELDQRYRDLRGALHESRGENKDMKQRLRNMEEVMQNLLLERRQQNQPKPPDPQENPLGYYDYRLEEQGRQLNELKQQNEALTEQQRTQAEFQNFMRAAVAEEQEFAAKTPDYYQAAAHLEQARRLELGIIYPDNDATYAQAREAGFPTIQAFREAVLNQDRIAVARQARQLGINAGEYYYRLASARGYQKPPAAAPGQGRPNGQSTLQPGQGQSRASDGNFERMEKGMAASGSLSTAGGAPNEAPDNDTVEQLAQMYLDDPKEADKMFARMKKAGKLG